MTSNLGSDLIQENRALGYEGMKEYMSVVSRHFRPEFINRIDETVVFHPLGKENIRAIASIQLQRLVKRMETHGYQLQFSDAVLDFIGEVGYDPIYGARPLKRAIQQVENPFFRKRFYPAKLFRVN